MFHRMHEITNGEQHRGKEHDGRERLHSISSHDIAMLSE